MNPRYYNKHIIYKKDYVSDLLTDAYKTLWHKDSDPTLKFNALDFIAEFINHSDVKDRLEYLYSVETSPQVRKVMKSILENQTSKSI